MRPMRPANEITNHNGLAKGCERIRVRMYALRKKKNIPKVTMTAKYDDGI
jgi:hypothetical protein